MNKINIIVISLWLIVVSSSTQAIEETGTEILDTCLSEKQALVGHPVKSVRYGLCLGYLKAIADTLNGSSFCLPQTGETVLITQQLKQVYIDYAINHKHQLSKPALETILSAYKKAFPCSLK